MKRVLFLLIGSFCSIARAQVALPIPDTLSGTQFNLQMHVDSVQFFPGRISHTYAFNQFKYLGPTLFLRKGDQVQMNVHNALPDTTTVHWHGLHVPSACDGGPHTLILPNQDWNPQFKVMDHAATFWYHPHLHHKTALQAIRGAAGLIIVRDSAEASLALPRSYGVDDFPLIVQCQQYDSANQAMPRGMQDSTLLVNGAMHAFLNLPAQVVRLRLLNASGERSFNFGFTNNMHFYQIASDGGLLESPFDTTRVRLGPGERAELLLNLSAMAGHTIHLMSYASELPMGFQGGPTMPMPAWSPPMDSPLNGINFDILPLNIVAPTSNAITTVPPTLVPQVSLLEQDANLTRTIRFEADSIMVMDGPFYFNGELFDMMHINYEIPINNTEIWKLVNNTMVAHPFHIHDVQFQVIDRYTQGVSKSERGRKDVVLVPPFDSVRFITKFEDFTDSLIPYMYHCHILMHEDDGMMGQFTVVNHSNGILKIQEARSFMMYPNPSKDLVYVQTKQAPLKPEVRNVLGETMQVEMEHGIHTWILHTEHLPAGSYTIRVGDDAKVLMKYN